MKETVSKLGLYAHNNHIDISVAFEQMLDFFIGTFSVERLIGARFDMPAVLSERSRDDAALSELQERWIRISTREMASQGVYDFFGTMYEEVVKGKFKSGSMGQFFTPMSLCMAMAETAIAGGETVEDSACGSGRTLLAHWAKADRTKLVRYRGADLDPVCVKMCALNMMMNGMIGSVLHGNSLTGEVFSRYEVNEVKWPFPNPACSIRRITSNQNNRR